MAEANGCHQGSERWHGHVNITDLHIRGSRLFKSIDCSALSDFILLAGARNPVDAEEC
jgi:hypothetical protein